MKNLFCVPVFNLRYLSSEEIGASLRHPDVGPGLVLLQPTPVDRIGEAGAVLGRRPLVLEQERAVDLLNVDAPVFRGANGSRRRGLANLFSQPLR